MDELLELNSKIKPNLKKDTRWDRIRKKHINALNVRTETVKKFFDLDYIDSKQIRLLNGDLDEKSKLNPALVMDLRHEMIERIAKRKREINIEKQMSIERLKAHNQLVEKHFISNELTKFKTDIEKSRLKANKRLQRPKLCLNNLSNKNIFESLEKCNDTIEDFYCAPIDALQEATRLSEESTCRILLPSNESDSNNSKDSFNTSSTAEVDALVYSKNSVNNTEKDDNRCVRFENSVKIINYSRDDSFGSNTSDGVDSVISELTEDVLRKAGKEINMEMVGRHIEIATSSCCDINKSEKSDFVEVHKTINRSELDNKDIIFQVNDDLLRITKLEPDSDDIHVIVEVQGTEYDEDDDNSKNTETESSNEQNTIIADLFRPKLPQQEILMRQYFLKWIHFVTIEKIERENITNKNDRIHKINAFLDSLRREKRKAINIKTNEEFDSNVNVNRTNANCGQTREKSIVLTKKYQNKIKVQQDIIELQKLKLERQERMIMELKLNKLSEDAKLSKQQIKEELKNVIKTGDVKNRSKAKCLQLVGDLRDQEDHDEFARLQGKALMMPKFLQKMQERALERNTKHDQARQRRLQQDAEKEAAKAAVEDARRQEDEEAKRLRIEALKEKRRQEKMTKVLKERERQRAVENNKKSEQFSRHQILKFGIEAFKRIYQLKRKNCKIAEIFRRKLLKRKYFANWLEYYVQIWEEKEKKADYMYVRNLNYKAFRGWVFYVAEEKSQFMVAVDWYELKLTEFVFNQWLGFVKLHKIIEETKLRQAESHYQWHMKWKVVDRWQRLPQILKLEKETEERRQRWRLKIWELLPDYTPNTDEQV